MYSKVLSLSVVFLSVLGLYAAPIQNPEESLFARNPPISLHRKDGTVHHFQLGHHAGTGTYGVVHHVASHTLPGHHPPLVHKTLHHHVAHEEHAKFDHEIKNLKQVGHLAYAGRDHNGKVHAIMHAVPGVHLQHTEAYKKAVAHSPGAVEQLKAHANHLAAAKRQHHVDHHFMHHDDMQKDNIKFTEHHGVLHEAHLMDWGRAHDTRKPVQSRFHQEKTIITVDHRLELYLDISGMGLIALAH
jgi:hypothetical protein